MCLLILLCNQVPSSQIAVPRGRRDANLTCQKHAADQAAHVTCGWVTRLHSNTDVLKQLINKRIINIAMVSNARMVSRYQMHELLVLAHPVRLMHVHCALCTPTVSYWLSVNKSDCHDEQLLTLMRYAEAPYAAPNTAPATSCTAQQQDIQRQCWRINGEPETEHGRNDLRIAEWLGCVAVHSTAVTLAGLSSDSCCGGAIQ
jgi:hypothetical protein